MNTERPQFTHDCTECSFLGWYTSPMTSATDPERCNDLYYCTGAAASEGGSLIARFGSGPAHYMSVPVRAVLYAGYDGYHPLIEALRRQIQVWRGDQ